MRHNGEQDRCCLLNVVEADMLNVVGADSK